MFGKISVNNMLDGLDGHLGEDDYSEPLEILINSANKNNKFNLFGAFAFKNQLKDRLKMRSRLHNFMKGKDLPPPSDPIFVTGLPRSGTTFLFNLLALDKNHRSPRYWEIMSPLPITKIIDEYYAEVQKIGGKRWDTSSLIKRFRK